MNEKKDWRICKDYAMVLVKRARILYKDEYYRLGIDYALLLHQLAVYFYSEDFFIPDKIFKCSQSSSTIFSLKRAYRINYAKTTNNNSSKYDRQFSLS